VDLVNSKDFHDVHAIAGLLKLYLRELPSTVLTRERHVDFLHIVGKTSCFSY
jgi:RalA-binding protein 1